MSLEQCASNTESAGRVVKKQTHAVAETVRVLNALNLFTFLIKKICTN